MISSFPNIATITNVERPLIKNTNTFHPDWVAGFVSAEGCFYIEIKKSSSMKIGYQVLLVFKITQHVRDEQLLKNLVVFLEFGRYYKRPKENAGDILCKSLK